MRWFAILWVCVFGVVMVSGARAEDPKKPNRPKRQRRFDPQQFFERLDRNGDGVLTKDELPERLQERLERLDQNQDGKLTRDELRRVGFQRRGDRRRPVGGPLLDRAFNRFDRNNDGFLTPDELPERARERFMRADQDGDGKVSKDEFRRMVAAFQPPWGGDRSRDSAAGQNLFRLLDSNRDGRLSRSELQNAVKILDRLDRNGNGLLEQQEIFSMAASRPQGPDRKEIEQRIAAIFERIDSNGDGKISKDEARGPLADNFDRADGNGDGFISRDEFLRGAMRRFQQAGGFPGRFRDRDRQPAGPSFDDFDKDVDGRLTKSEVQGTPLANQFDQIDRNGDGKIDPKEYRAFRRKNRGDRD